MAFGVSVRKLSKRLPKMIRQVRRFHPPFREGAHFIDSGKALTIKQSG